MTKTTFENSIVGSLGQDDPAPDGGDAFFRDVRTRWRVATAAIEEAQRRFDAAAARLPERLRGLLPDDRDVVAAAPGHEALHDALTAAWERLDAIEREMMRTPAQTLLGVSVMMDAACWHGEINAHPNDPMARDWPGEILLRARSDLERIVAAPGAGR